MFHQEILKPVWTKTLETNYFRDFFFAGFLAVRVFFWGQLVYMTRLPLVHLLFALGSKVAWTNTSILHLVVASVPFWGAGKPGSSVMVHFEVPLALRVGTH